MIFERVGIYNEIDCFQCNSMLSNKIFEIKILNLRSKCFEVSLELAGRVVGGSFNFLAAALS